MNAQSSPRAVGISQTEQDRIERFLTAFNCIKKHLQEELNQGPKVDMRELVKHYSAQHTGWRDADILCPLGTLRNLLVHERYGPHKYFAVPTEETVLTIEQIRDRLLRPERVIPRFQKGVKKVDMANPLADVLALIVEHDFSQFPVYECEQFRGLLTENGIPRWLAHHSRNTDTLVELTEVPVQKLFDEEEIRNNYRFLPRDMLMDDLIIQFSQQPLLEAVLITDTGSQGQSLLGIVSRWDILEALERIKCDQ